MYCSECGCKLEDNALACPNCGAEAEAGEVVEEDVLEDTQVSGGIETLDSSKVPEDFEGVDEAVSETKEKGRVTFFSLAKVIDRRVDSCFQTKAGKIVWGILVAGAAVSICILVGKGIWMQKNYGWLNDYQLTETSIGELEIKLESKLKTADAVEQSAGKILSRYEYLASYSLETDWETEIKKQITERLAENQVLVQQFKAYIMDFFGYAYTPSYNQRQYEELGLDGFRDEVIDAAVGDSAVGGILGEGLKSALGAAAENTSLDNILEGAKEGLIDGSVGYVRDEIIGDLGSNVLAVLDTVQTIQNKIQSMGIVPPEALNQMGEQQKKYLEELQQFAEKERITREDMLNAYDAYCSFSIVNHTMRALVENGDEAVECGREPELEKIIGKYSRNEEFIRKCIAMAEGGLE